MITGMRPIIYAALIFLFFAFTCKPNRSGIMENNTIVRIETSFGNIDILLYDETPDHRDNFIKLVNDGFYNNLLFHRVIENFMIQGGDPLSRDAEEGTQIGSGGPGYTIPAEIHNHIFHKKGALASARLGDNVNPERESSGSQFYIVHGNVISQFQLDEMESKINDQQKQQFASQLFRDLEREYLNKDTEPDYHTINEQVSNLVKEHFNETQLFKFSDEQIEAYTTIGGTPHLDRAYTVFGETIEGFDVIDKIAAVETGSGSRPLSDVIIKRITILN